MLALRARTDLGAFHLDVELSVAPNRCLALAGPSGAGKSTILRIVAGILRPTDGHVRCAGQTWLDTEHGIDHAPDRRRCGYVFQDYALFPHLSAWQNVAFPMGARGRDRRARAEALLERFGLADRADEHPRTLSGGERQRVAVARALALQPAALLLDEPLSALDARTRARAARELKRTLADIDVPTLLVTHDFGEAALLGDDVGVIDSGRIVQRGSPGELAARPATAFVADFTGAVVLTGTARPGRNGSTIVELDGGGTITSLDTATGPVAATVFPWEIVLEPIDAQHSTSAQNRLPAEIISATAIGNRVRVALAASQPMTAEISTTAAAGLHLRAGEQISVSWKAAGTRLVAL